MIALVNPQATRWRYRIPLSVLSIGASLEGRYPYHILDGNLDGEIFASLPTLVREKQIKYVGFTVMPGPQLQQSILLSKMIRATFPTVRIIWGGYFPTLHTNVTLQAPYVDYVIRDQGDHSFRKLIDVLESGGSLNAIPGLSYKNGAVRHNHKEVLLDPNELSPPPYRMVDIHRYVGRTYLGTRTINYHSSVGCPFLCGF